MENLSICMISKFPPIEGGISSTVYWLIRGLAESGISVHVVTNADCVEDEYRIAAHSDIPLPEGIQVHQVDKETPWHIPYSQMYLDKLLDKTLTVAQDYHVDIIDSFYLVPYAVAGYLTHAITGLPFIVRHGGSDLAKFWKTGRLKNLFRLLFSEAAFIVTSDKDLLATGAKAIEVPRYVPDERFFYPVTRSSRPITCAYIGKINYHWQHRGLDYIVKMALSLGKRVKILFLAQGKGKKDFLEQCSTPFIEFMDFIPPWEIPSFLKSIDYLFYLTDTNPLPDFPNIVLEALSSGVKILTDQPALLEEICGKYFDLGRNIMDISPFLSFSDPDKLFYFLEEGMGFTPAQKLIQYSEYIKANVELYETIAI